MISIFVPDPKHGIRAIEFEEFKRLHTGDPADAPVVWVDLNDPTTEEEDLILDETFHFHHLAILDCRAERLKPNHGDHLPKVEDYGSYLFSIINPIEMVTERDSHGIEWQQISTLQLNVFLGVKLIVTHHYEPSAAISKVLSLCSKNPLHLERGPDYIYHMILDYIVDQYNPILDRFDEDIDQLEDEIFLGVNQRTLERILNMKRQVFSLRRITSYQREMLHRLSRGEFELITQEEVAYYRNVFDHLVRATELSESYRDVLTGMLDAYLSITSNRLNEIMKVLAIISTFFLPLTFVAGVYGMNFNTATSRYNMPELNWVYGYPFAWGVMIIMAIGMFIYFKRKRWL
jgi:magnesium transporter